MRVFILMCLISALPLSLALAADGDYYHVHYGDASQSPQGTMGYWDDGGYARNLLMGSNLTDSRQSRLDYSAPQDNSMRQYTPIPASPSDSLIFHSQPTIPNTQNDNQNSDQP